MEGSAVLISWPPYLTLQAKGHANARPKGLLSVTVEYHSDQNKQKECTDKKEKTIF
jgi:hypothetical protein